MLALLLHGDAPFGWKGFAFAALGTLALCLIFNELAKAALKKRNPKANKKTGRRHSGPYRKTQAGLSKTMPIVDRDN
jgi:hypothetical protein